MSLEYIRNYYNVPAYRLAKVKYGIRNGKIVGHNNAHLKVKLQDPDIKRVYYIHPTDEKLKYLGRD